MIKSRSPARRSNSRPAAAAAELAVLLPFLVLLLVLCTDFARVFYFYVAVTNCARNGALWASDPVAKTTSPYATLDQAVAADSSGLSLQSATSNTGTDANGNAYVQVTVSYNASLLTSYLGFGSIKITRTVQMRQAPSVPN
jgi:hypothetical protein